MEIRNKYRKYWKNLAASAQLLFQVEDPWIFFYDNGLNGPRLETLTLFLFPHMRPDLLGISSIFCSHRQLGSTAGPIYDPQKSKRSFSVFDWRHGSVWLMFLFKRFSIITLVFEKVNYSLNSCLNCWGWLISWLRDISLLYLPRAAHSFYNTFHYNLELRKQVWWIPLCCNRASWSSDLKSFQLIFAPCNSFVDRAFSKFNTLVFSIVTCAKVQW